MNAVSSPRLPACGAALLRVLLGVLFLVHFLGSLQKTENKAR